MCELYNFLQKLYNTYPLLVLNLVLFKFISANELEKNNYNKK